MMRLYLFADPERAGPEGSFPQAIRLARELRRRGHRALAVAPTEAGRRNLERVEGIPVRRVGWGSDLDGPPGSIGALGSIGSTLLRGGARWSLRSWIQELKGRPPAALHAHLSVPAVWYTARAARALALPWVLTATGAGAGAALARLARGGAFARELSSCAALAAPTERVLERLAPWCAPGVVRSVIPCGVDGSGDGPISRVAGAGTVPSGPNPGAGDGNSGPVILGLGRQEADRRWEVLLRALPQVHERRPDALLLLAGSGPSRRRLQRLANSLPYRSRAAIRWEETPSAPGAAELIDRAELAVFPGEGPSALLAAARVLEAGRPAVIADPASFPFEAIDGGNSLVVPPDDAASLAQAILRLLENSDLARRIGSAGQGEAARRCGWSEVASAYIEIFDRLATPAARR